jgi:histidine triad (HIT) family protein
VAQPCIFCAIVDRTAPAEVIAEDARAVAFMDIQPATDGHALVVPRRHADDLLDVGAEDLAAVAALSQRVAAAAVRALGADGVNLLQASRAAAFQTVFHLHVHVIPRYPDDGIRLPWIPTPGDRERIGAHAGSLRAAL